MSRFHLTLLATSLIIGACSSPVEPDGNGTSEALKWADFPANSQRDVAVLSRGDRLEAVTSDGAALASTVMGGDISWCRVDPRGEVVWLLTVRPDDSQALELFDLTTNRRATIAEGLPGGLDAVWIRYGDQLDRKDHGE